MTLKLVEARVDLAIVELLGSLPNTLEHERLGVETRINAKYVENNTRSRPIIPRADNISVADDEE